MPSALADLPPEVLLDNLFPLLPTVDLLRLTILSKYFASLASDETLWRRRLREDFNFDGAGTARTTGWKFIYRGLYRPRVYVWGDRNNGRLGLRRYPECARRGVPFPMQLDLPGTSIVRLTAGGMSFHALDTQGNVYIWGTLDGSDYARPNEGYSAKGKRAATPLRLQLPNPIRSISCGRLHSCALDNKNQIWTFVNWGRPFLLSSPLLSQPDSEPVQVKCGWTFVSVLMITGEVLIWWPSTGTLAEKIAQEAQNLNTQDVGMAHATEGGVIPCHTWEVVGDPVLLPSLPQLPDVTGGGDYKNKPPRLVQIGGMDSHMVGLTNYGHVVLFRGLDHEQAIGTRGWEYLPEFTEASRVSQLSEFSKSDIAVPKTMRVTHVSAHFDHFFAFSTGSSSIVLQGDTTTTPESKPKIIPQLQYKNIISVELGDYHGAALSADGKLYTWGQYSNGALGLGDPRSLPIGAPGGFMDQIALDGDWRRPPDVLVPTEVSFDHGRKTRKDRFCFSATAAGWHTGALVIDLEPDENEEDDEIHLEYEEPREWVGASHSHTGPPLVPQIIHRGAPFVHRIGFAGRGMGRGRGHPEHSGDQA